mgnify:CR=1 FL=1
MRTGRPKQPIILSKSEEEQLKLISRSRSFSHGLVTRAKIIIMSAEGTFNKDIARKLDYSPQSVSLWRQRFLEQGISGLHDELRSGRQRFISDEQVAELVRKTLQTKPMGRTHSMAEETTIPRPTVQRIWNAFGLQPHRQRHFKISTDPFFVNKVPDIVGL